MKIVKIKSTNRITLEADWYQAKSDKVIIIVHGFTSNRHEWGKYDIAAKAFNQAGYNVLNVDMSGSGESDDTPILVKQWEQDLVACLKMLRKQGYGKIGVFASSMGGLTALRVAAYENFNAFVGLAPVTNHLKSLKKDNRKQIMGIRLIGKIKREVKDPKSSRKHVVVSRKLMKELFTVNQEKLLKPIAIPSLFLHGTADKRIPYQESLKVAELNPNITTKIVDGADHTFTKHTDTFVDASIAWFNDKL